jgi:hypothetical protein
VITLRSATLKALAARRLPVTSEYDVFLVIRELTKARSFNGERIRITNDPPNRRVLGRVVRQLLENRLLRPDPDFYGTRAAEEPFSVGRHYRVLRVSDMPEGSAEDVCSLIDPFCHVSHLSAMQLYGLTDRFSRELIVTRPAMPLWRRLRDEKVARDYGGLPSKDETPDPLGGQAFAPLERISLPENLRGRPMVYHTTTQQPELHQADGGFTRIAAVGDVFVQMLDRPDLCGGMPHVVEVWTQEAPPHVESIIRAVERDAEAIVKVRAGYLLNEVLSIRDARIDAWTKYAQRGGSRKLDPVRPYIATFSEKWMISLNVDSPLLPSGR